jgi:hypothetical protein
MGSDESLGKGSHAHRRATDPLPPDTGLAAELLQQVLDRPPSADTREAHELAVLQAQAEQAKAMAELFGTLHVLALEVRSWLAEHRADRRQGGDRRKH